MTKNNDIEIGKSKCNDAEPAECNNMRLAKNGTKSDIIGLAKNKIWQYWASQIQYQASKKWQYGASKKWQYGACKI